MLSHQHARERCLQGARMSFEDLRQILGKRRAGHHHVAAGLLRLLFELALHVGKISDEADALHLRVLLQRADEIERPYGVEIQVENNQ